VDEDTGEAVAGGASIDMLLTTSLTVAAETTTFFKITYSEGGIAGTLELVAGWNLVALPFEPLDPTIAAIFDDANVTADEPSELRDRRRGTIYSGMIWLWTGNAYEAATELHALQGAWVFVEEDVTLAVEGMPVEVPSVDLVRGWNLFGPATEVPAPIDSRIWGHIWCWDPASKDYLEAQELLPWLGHWVNAKEAFSLPMGGAVQR